MGMFSWYYADIDENIVEGDLVYMLMPNGNYFEGIYDGYGRINDIDIYYVFAVLNREDIIAKKIPLDANFNGKGEEYYKVFCDMNVSNEFLLTNHLKYEDNIRVLGINYDCLHYEALYPIKLTSKPLNYYSVSKSEEDPEQGFYKHKKNCEEVCVCSCCGTEFFESDGYDEDYCSLECYLEAAGAEEEI